jgi:hypothetical protein
MNAETTRWTIVVDYELDRSLRRHLADCGGKKGDISAFVTQAVNKALLRDAQVRNWERNKDLSEKDLEQLELSIADEVHAVRQQNSTNK